MLPTLAPRLRHAYLERLGVDVGSALDLESLTELQQAHLRSIPFHNLGLLANDGAAYTVPDLLDVVRDNARGVGGTCHLTTPSFAVLLSSLGFDVELVSGCVRQPDDHLLALVRLSEGPFVVDVGNGHPYPYPMPLGADLAWGRHGWSFRWSGNRLVRRLGDDERRLVYTVDPTPRTWESFHPTIRAHHEVSGFGPFFESLRAVRIHDERILVVKDATLSRWAGRRRWERPLLSVDTTRRVLEDTLGLDPELVGAGLASLTRRRPALFDMEPPTPRILVAIQTVGRTHQLTELLDSIEDDLKSSELDEDALRVLVIDNGPPAGTADLDDSVQGRAFDVEVQAVGEIDLQLERSLGLVQDERRPLSIGACRHALVRAAQARLDRLDGPWVVWLLDDDLRLTQRTLEEDGLHDRRVASSVQEIIRLWRYHPEISVGLGTFCGDPPVPGFATWWGQVRDLTATLSVMKGMHPEQAWPKPSNDRTVRDFYYDHSDDSLALEHRVFVFEGGIGAPAADVLELLAERLLWIAAGRQVFRTLLATPPRTPRPSTARGGHVLFLDPEAMISAPFPSIEGPDGVVSRRADSIAALLLAEEPGFGCFEVDLPLLHRRMPDDGSSPMAATDPSRARGAAFIDAQARGIALTRALALKQPHRVGTMLDARRELHRRGLRCVREALPLARDVLRDPKAWWNEMSRFRTTVQRLDEGLRALEARIPDDSTMGAAEADIAASLEENLERLPAAAKKWRASWR